MGWLSDLFKEIPLSVIQQEKIAQAEKKQSEIEAEKASLKDDLRQAKAEITKLKKQIHELAHTETIDGMELEFLKAISEHDILSDEEIAELLRLRLQRVKFHLQRLNEIGYIKQSTVTRIGQPFPYHLTHKGRAFLIDQGLL